ncbi:MAG TPA: FtsQ-type POTRA domain-containing protein [Mycobacteriales bacterium]|jgi:cell division protein FtsQ|nr:FtsQ-type POTRA domain-containing protein [Mycobacteriales bacterium]
MSGLAGKILPARMLRRQTYTVGGGIVLALAIVTIYIAGFTSVLAVHKVTVSGLHRLTEKGVLAVAKVPEGKPLARLDLKPIQDRVAALPGVARVDVRRAWPNGVRIVVTERAGVVVAERGGAQWLLDADGVAFQRLRGTVSGIPRLTPALNGKPDAATRAALRVAADLPTWLRVRTIGITAKTPDSVTLSLTKGRTVQWGGATRDADKAQVLQALLKQSGTVYDVQSPKVVAVR